MMDNSNESPMTPAVEGMPNGFKFYVSMNQEDRDELEAILKAEKDLCRRRYNLNMKGKKYDSVKSALLMASRGSPVGCEIIESNSMFIITCHPQPLPIEEKKVETQKPAAPAPAPKPYVAPLHMDSKTLNVMLSGKLLDEGQKRALLKRIYPDAAEVFDKAKD